MQNKLPERFRPSATIINSQCSEEHQRLLPNSQDSAHQNTHKNPGSKILPAQTAFSTYPGGRILPQESLPNQILQNSCRAKIFSQKSEDELPNLSLSLSYSSEHEEKCVSVHLCVNSDQSMEKDQDIEPNNRHNLEGSQLFEKKSFNNGSGYCTANQGNSYGLSFNNTEYRNKIPELLSPTSDPELAELLDKPLDIENLQPFHTHEYERPRKGLLRESEIVSNQDLLKASRKSNLENESIFHSNVFPENHSHLLKNSQSEDNHPEIQEYDTHASDELSDGQKRFLLADLPLSPNIEETLQKGSDNINEEGNRGKISTGSALILIVIPNKFLCL